MGPGADLGATKIVLCALIAAGWACHRHGAAARRVGGRIGKRCRGARGQRRSRSAEPLQAGPGRGRGAARNRAVRDLVGARGRIPDVIRPCSPRDGYRLARRRRDRPAEHRRRRAARRQDVAVDDRRRHRPGRTHAAARGLVARREGEPRVARAGRRDGVVRSGPARDRAGLHALPAPGRNGRAGHARSWSSATARAPSAPHRGRCCSQRPGQPALRYGALSAVDANGKALPAELELHGGGLASGSRIATPRIRS